MAKYVCQSCIEDVGLQAIVEKHEENEKCSYCGSPRAAYLEYVTDHMMEAIGTEYGDIEDNLDVNGQLPDHCDIDGVFSDLGFNLKNEDLMSDIRSTFGDRVYTLDQEADFLHGVRFDAWRQFQDLVKHKRRYTFSTFGYAQSPDLDPLLWTPRNLLDNVAKTIHELSLIETVPAGTTFWRVRLHDTGRTFDLPKDFTSPPRKCAIYANRMSPAGVPMFYGADDFETAVLEVTSPDETYDNKSVTGMKFATVSDLSMLDLTALPRMESCFVDWDQWKRMGISFLSSFVHDLSRPTTKNGQEHIDHVPSQVFTEHIRFEVKTASGGNIMGIKYPSSRNGKVCCVLFVEQQHCLPNGGTGDVIQVLDADMDSLRTETANGGES